jgi:hypothetical protein
MEVDRNQPISHYNDNEQAHRIFQRNTNITHRYSIPYPTPAASLEAHMPMELWMHVIACMASPQKEALALTAVDKRAFKCRFEFTSMQQLHFKSTKNVEEFLSHCRATNDAEGFTSTMRVASDYQKVKKLTLTLSDQLKAEQCSPLLKYLTGLTHLKLHLALEQSAASLNGLLEAAHSCTLQQLTIIKPISRSSTLVDTLPDTLWECRTLKALRIEGLCNLQSISENIGQLRELKSLKLKDLWKLQCLPRNLFCLPKLEKLILEHITIEDSNSAEVLFDSPQGIVQLQDKLKSIKLINIRNFTPGPSLWNLINLEELVLDRLAEVVIPEEIGQLTALKSLKLRCLDAVEQLPEALWDLNKLEHLILEADGITDISDKIRQLTALKSLTIALQRLHTVTEEIGQLRNLSSLEIHYYVPNVWPESLWNLTNLKHLDLHTWEDDLSVPDEINNFTNLKSLELTYFSANLEVLQSLNKLERLTLDGFHDIATLPREMLYLTSLQTLTLYDMPKLISLPFGLSTLPHLQEIFVGQRIPLVMPAELDMYRLVE